MRKILEKRERSLGIKLSRKGERANSPKAALVRKPYRPGQHGKRFNKLSEFGTQLKEKQKIKFSYGVTEKQLRKIFREAEKHSKRGLSASDMVVGTLERRLDNVIMRLGITEGRSRARQMVSHGHFMINGRKVRVPSYKVKVGDKISIRPQSSEMSYFAEVKDRIKKYEPPAWLKLDKNSLEAEVVEMPRGIETLFDVSLVVDFYSKK